MKHTYNKRNQLIGITISTRKTEKIIELFHSICSNTAFVFTDCGSGAYRYYETLKSNQDLTQSKLLQWKKELDNALSITICDNRIENVNVDKINDLFEKQKVSFIFEFEFGENTCHVLMKNIGDRLEIIQEL